FVLTLAASAVVVALNFVTLNLPPAVQMLLPWRWAILFGLNAVLLLFLTLQLFLGFNIESSFKERARDNPSLQKEAKNTEEEKKAEAMFGMEVAWLYRTNALRLVVVLHVLATVTAGLVYWI